MHRAFTGLPVLFCLSAPLQAGEDIDHLAGLATQENFRRFSEDLAAVVSYKAVATASAMGASGFDFGVTANSIKLEHPELWDLACACDAPGRVLLSKVYLRFGGPEADLVLSYGTAQDSNLDVWGVEAHFGLVPEDATTPAVSLRGTFSRLSGVERLDFDSKGLELTVSKRFGAFTPYLGGGQVWIRSDPDPALFQREHFTAEKFYAGINLALGRTNLAFEGDETGDVRSYSAKLTWRF